MNVNYNQQHKFYCGVDLHARSLFVHVLDHKGKSNDAPRNRRRSCWPFCRKRAKVGEQCNAT